MTNRQKVYEINTRIIALMRKSSERDTRGGLIARAVETALRADAADAINKHLLLTYGPDLPPEAVTTAEHMLDTVQMIDALEDRRELAGKN